MSSEVSSGFSVPRSSSGLWEVSVFCRSPEVSSSSGLSLIWDGLGRDGVLRTGRGGGRGEQALEVELEAAEGVGDRLLLTLA